MTTPGYFDVKVSDGKHALFDVKLDDLSEKPCVPSPQHGLRGGGLWSAGALLSEATIRKAKFLAVSEACKAIA